MQRKQLQEKSLKKPTETYFFQAFILQHITARVFLLFHLRPVDEALLLVVMQGFSSLCFDFLFFYSVKQLVPVGQLVTVQQV